MCERPLLSCRHLTFHYDETPTFSDLSLTVESGEAVLLMGPSGCGKSSLAYCLAGLYPEYAGRLEGEILLDGKPLGDYAIARRAGLVSILFQNPDNQFCMDRVDHEILFALENIHYTGDLQARLAELLDFVGLSPWATAPLHTLSGGTKQKLALATALATEAKLLILDEPFANLDPASCAELSAKLEVLNRQGLTLLVVDHRPDYWRPFLSRLLLMNADGQLDPTPVLPGELEAHRADFAARGLFLDDRWLENRHPPTLPQSSPPMVQAENLSLLHGKTPFLTGLSFQMPQGSVTALVGRNGSGKTSLLSALAGVGRWRGSLRVAGEAGLVFQNPRFQFLTLSVEEEVCATLRVTAPTADAAALSREATALLDEFALLPWRAASPYALSQGQQRRLALLSMLAGNRPLLLLDEPTYAQDEQSTRFILDLLERRVAAGLTAVLATHDLALAQACANQILLLEDGRLTPLSPADLNRYAKEAGQCAASIPAISC
ncbi:MAG: ABC transporter ATP-binding protein [Oscillospiraceae bacterium]